MQYKNLGKSGLMVSCVCLGCMSFGDPAKGRHSWILNEEESRPIIRHAFEAGINFFDTANVYGAGTSEEVLGRAIKDIRFVCKGKLPTKLERIVTAPSRPACITCRKS